MTLAHDVKIKILNHNLHFFKFDVMISNVACKYSVGQIR